MLVSPLQELLLQLAWHLEAAPQQTRVTRGCTASQSIDDVLSTAALMRSGATEPGRVSLRAPRECAALEAQLDSDTNTWRKHGTRIRHDSDSPTAGVSSQRDLGFAAGSGTSTPPWSGPTRGDSAIFLHAV